MRGAAGPALSSLFLMLLVAADTASKDSGKEKWIHTEGEQHSYPDQIIEVGSIGSSPLRILLIGKTGVGKSSTGNTILGEKLFDSKAGFNSVTSSCNKKSREWRGRELVVIDTPGLFDTKISLLDTAKEIGRCVAISSPGPHAVLLVLEVGRFTKEEKETVEKLQDLFGKEALKYMIVLFNRKDDLGGDSIHQTVNSSDDKELKVLLENCRNRYHAFNNKAQGNEREEQVAVLIDMIDQMVAENGGTCFSNEIYVQAEKMIKEKEEELKKDYMEKLELEKDKLKLEMEEKIAKLREENNSESRVPARKKVTPSDEDEIRLKYKEQEEENKRKPREYNHRRAREDSEKKIGESFWQLILIKIKSWFVGWL